MDCRTARILSTGHLDGELGPPLRARLRAHLKECAACRRAAEAERELGRRLSEAAGDFPGSLDHNGFWRAVKARLPARRASPRSRYLGDGEPPWYSDGGL